MYHGLSSGRLMSSGARGWRKKSLLTTWCCFELPLLSESSLSCAGGVVWGLLAGLTLLLAAAEGFRGALEFWSGPEGPEPLDPEADPPEAEPPDPPPVQV